MQSTLALMCLLVYGASFSPEASAEAPPQTPQFCTKTVKDEACIKNDCVRTTKTPCYHGVCSDTGVCVCQACWLGPSCNDADNKHAPVFIRRVYEKYISPDEPTEYPFMYVRATDKDEATCGTTTGQCPCSEVVYSLDDEEKGAKPPTFVIDPSTGGISVVAGASLAPNSKHRLKAHAWNGVDHVMQGSVPIVIIVSDMYLRDSEQSFKLRRLQSAPEISILDSNQTLDITFLPSEADAAVGALTVGTRVDCELTINIPESAVVQGINVEIFTADENKTLSVLCPPTVSLGAEIQITDSDVPQTSYYEPEVNPFLLDTSIINFGNVTNLNSSINAQDSKILVAFAITLKEDISLAADDRYWVSAGVEYSEEAKLWIGQIGFHVDQIPQYAPNTNVTIEGPIDYYEGEVEVFNVDLNMYRSVANLTVQAIADANIKEKLMICELQLCNTGNGFCLDITKDLATFQVDEISQNAYESVFAFGNIVNGGVANSTADSRVSMDVVTYLRQESGLSDGSSYGLTASTDDGIQPSQDRTTFTVRAARSYVSPASVWTMNVSIIDGDNELVPGESAKIRVALDVPASSSASPVSIQLNTQVPELQICAVRINHIGDDISCLLQRRDVIENNVIYATGPTATINLHGVANTGGESTANGVNDMIGIDFVVKSTMSDLLENGNTRTVASTVNCGTLTASDNLDVKWVTDPVAISYPVVPEGDPNPVSSSFDLLEPTGTSEAAPGEYILLAIRPVVLPDTQYRYVATALTNSTDLNILDMRVLTVGSNIACGLLTDPVATYTSSLGNVAKDTAELDLGLVYNFARPWSATTEEDSLEILLAVQVTGEAQEPLIPVAVSLMVGSTRLWVAEGNITNTPSAAMDPVLPSNTTLVAAPFYSTEVTPASETKILHTLIVPANTSSKYLVNYTTTATWLQITSINVTSVGDNLACIQEGILSPINSQAGIFVLVDLDYMCNIPIGNATDENGKLVLELTIEISNSSDVEVGMTAVLSANLEVSNALGNKTVETTTVIFAIELPNSTFKLCCPESAFFMRPGETERCNVTMTILDDTAVILLELDTPFNGTAAMTMNNVEVGPRARNVQFNEPNVVFVSDGNTSQNNFARLDFGRVFNTGEYTAEAGTLMDGDNDIVVHIDVQMADADQNVNGSYHALEAGVGVSGGAFIWVAYYKLAVLRDGTERPDLNVSFSLNTSLSTHAVGDTVWYGVEVRHDDVSSAEAIDVKGHVFLPPYIQFVRMVTDYNISNNQPAVGQSDDTTGFYFTLPRMFFTDHIAFSIEATIKTNYHYKMTKNWKGTTPIEVIYYASRYDTDHYTDGQYFDEPMDYVTFDFTVPYPDIPGPNPPPACGSPQAQGMESGTIVDCQITASFSPEPTAAAEHARLNGPSAWKTPARAGPYLYDRWIKVDLGRKIALTGVKTQGGISGNADGDLGEFEILYSLDDTLYKAATPANNKVFDHQKDSPADHNTVVTHDLLTAVEARYVILNLTAYDYNSKTKWYNAVRMEIMGCAIDSPTTYVCPTTAPVVDETYERGFLVDATTNTLFVCDTITHGKSGVRKELQASVYAFLWKKPDMHCFMMIYADKQWTGLDPRLRNIIGLLPSTGRLYGILSSSPDSYAASDKPYTEWYLIEKSNYDTAAGSDGFVQSISVPFLSQAGFTYATPDNYATSAYSLNEWKATMSGIYKDTEKVLDWNECCQPMCAANGGLDNCS